MLDNARGVIRSSRSLPGKPDVVLGPSVPLLTGLAAERIAYRFGVPFVFEVRDVWPDALVDMGGLSKTSPVYLAFRYIEKFLYRKAARISSTLPYLFNHVANSGGDPGKIIVIPNGIDLSKYDNNEQYDGGSNDRLTVMYVGGFGLDHDVPSIIEAARILQERGDRRFNFILMGDGVRKFECEVLAERYRLSNLAIKAPVPKSSLPIVQREADVFIAAITDSLSYRFGLNLNKLCSYFASGRPVLFAGNPPNNPVMEAGAGICVPAHDPDAIVSGLNKMAAVSSEGRLRMASYGREYAKNVIAMPALGDRMEAMLSRVVCEASSQSRRAK
jgi:glycosyltransferase involved in cell wall biosynthesis